MTSLPITSRFDMNMGLGEALPPLEPDPLPEFYADRQAWLLRHPEQAARVPGAVEFNPWTTPVALSSDQKAIDMTQLQPQVSSEIPQSPSVPAPLQYPTPTQSMSSSGIGLSPEQNAIFQQAAGLTKESIKKQEEDVARIKKFAEQYAKGENKMDLSPLVGLADAWGGSNLSKMYKAPDTPEQRALQAETLKQMAAKGQQGITDDQLKLLQLQFQKASLKNQGEKPLTDAQAKDSVFINMMTRGDENLSKVSQNWDPTSYTSGMGRTLLPNAAQSEENQLYNQSKLDFIFGMLRDQSGATVTPDEITFYTNAYFPTAGESEKVVAQKAQARAGVIQSMKAGMPPSWNPAVSGSRIKAYGSQVATTPQGGMGRAPTWRYGGAK